MQLCAVGGQGRQGGVLQIVGHAGIVVGFVQLSTRGQGNVGIHRQGRALYQVDVTDVEAGILLCIQRIVGRTEGDAVLARGQVCTVANDVGVVVGGIIAVGTVLYLYVVVELRLVTVGTDPVSCGVLKIHTRDCRR